MANQCFFSTIGQSLVSLDFRPVTGLSVSQLSANPCFSASQLSASLRFAPLLANQWFSVFQLSAIHWFSLSKSSASLWFVSLSAISPSACVSLSAVGQFVVCSAIISNSVVCLSLNYRTVSSLFLSCWPVCGGYRSVGALSLFCLPAVETNLCDFVGIFLLSNCV